MKKALIQIVIFTALLFTQTTVTLAFYTDVPEDHIYYQAIHTLESEGLLPDTEFFYPDKLLTKSELYKLLLTYAQTRLTLDIDLPYTDTDNQADYAPYLQTAINLGILKSPGYKTALGINNNVTKHQVLSTMFNSLGIGIDYFFKKDSFPFKDLNKDSALAALANKTYELGILEEEKPQYFRMAKRITRAQAVDYLYKIRNYAPMATITFTISSDGSKTYDSAQQELLDHQSFATLLDIWSILKNKYLYKEELDDEKLIFSAIKGMTDQVSDVYTVFQEPSQASQFVTTLSSEYEGIGVVIELIDNNVTVISPFKNSPAEVAGMLANDIIIEVDDENIVGQPLETIVSKIKGPAGTTVKIKVQRDSQTFTYDIERNFIMIKTVEGEIKQKDAKDIGVISILSFSEGTYEEFIDTANDLIAQSPDGFIIDLRNNPGGYMDVAVNIISLFTNEIETAVILEYVNGLRETYKTNGNGLLAGYEIVVLINEGTASASEILAGALQDLEIAKIIGEQSFGKGVVQELNQYLDNSLFKYTISKWLTPNGSNINSKGITPDQLQTNSGTLDSQLQTALNEF